MQNDLLFLFFWLLLLLLLLLFFIIIIIIVIIIIIIIIIKLFSITVKLKLPHAMLILRMSELEKVPEYTHLKHVRALNAAKHMNC